MKRFINNKEYISTDEYVREFKKCYLDKVGYVDEHIIHFLLNYYKVPSIKFHGITFYLKEVVDRVRGKIDFIETFKGIVDYICEYDIIKDINKNNKSYKTESIKRIKISEEKYYKLFEGASFTKNDDNTINLSIDSKQDDASNNDIDTRIFGTKKDILYGDNTLNKRSINLNDKFNNLYNLLLAYQSIIDYAENGFNGNLLLDYLDNGVKNKIVQFQNNNDSEGLKNWATNAYDRNYQILMGISDKKIRASVETDDTKKIGRYNKIRVQGTNVYCLALFTMNGFELSDAIKHGALRQNGKTDELLGIDPSSRKTIQSLSRGKKAFDRINVTYDNKFNYNIKNNFSYAGDKDHYKQSYKSKDDYSSVNQFLDKSIMYANYALKQENFIPDYIVAAPSSSEFNKYYCINLSRKIGVPFVENFFKRNLINVVLDEEQMIQDNLSETDIMRLKKDVLSAMHGEISSYAKIPINNFFEKYKDILTQISIGKNSREKFSEGVIKNSLYIYIYNALKEKPNEETKNVYKLLLNKMINNEIKFANSSSLDTNHIINEIMKRIKLNIGKKIFLQLLEEVDLILKQYENKIQEGFQINMSQFKIVKIEKRFRKYLNNVYVISDEMMNNDAELFTRYQNSKYLIFDEDINSGATLKLVIDALQDKLQNSQQNIMCLVNAYSSEGK